MISTIASRQSRGDVPPLRERRSESTNLTGFSIDRSVTGRYNRPVRQLSDELAACSSRTTGP